MPPPVELALVDYGAGNLTSVVHGLEAAGAEVRIARKPGDVEDAHGIVVPGVGHYAQTAVLDAAWRSRIVNAIERGVPLLGICLGMQWLFAASDEDPELAGLGALPGRAVRLTGDVKVPHVGWNRIERTPTDRPGSESVLMAGIADPIYGYFAHSYAVPAGPNATGVATHGVRFAAVVESGRVFGIQCHPEKSAQAGLAMLRNFVATVRPC